MAKVRKLYCSVAVKWIWLQIVMGDSFTLRLEIHNGRWMLEHVRGRKKIFLRDWRLGGGVEVPNLSEIFIFFIHNEFIPLCIMVIALFLFTNQLKVIK